MHFLFLFSGGLFKDLVRNKRPVLHLGLVPTFLNITISFFLISASYLQYEHWTGSLLACTDSSNGNEIHTSFANDYCLSTNRFRLIPAKPSKVIIYNLIRPAGAGGFEPTTTQAWTLPLDYGCTSNIKFCYKIFSGSGGLETMKKLKKVKITPFLMALTKAIESAERRE